MTDPKDIEPMELDVSFLTPLAAPQAAPPASPTKPAPAALDFLTAVAAPEAVPDAPTPAPATDAPASAAPASAAPAAPSVQVSYPLVPLPDDANLVRVYIESNSEQKEFGESLAGKQYPKKIIQALLFNAKQLLKTGEKLLSCLQKQ